MNRAQHIVPAGLIAAVGLWVMWISYTQEPADAFLFPRLISTVFVALALWTFAKACVARVEAGQGLSWQAVQNMAPGLVVALVYVFWAAKALGFYTATAVAVFILISLYDPLPHWRPGSWIRRVIVTAVFIAVMYGLFAMLLKVWTPREIFF